MRRTLTMFVGALCVLLPCGQALAEGGYFDADLALNLKEDTEMAATSAMGTFTGEVTFDPGLRLDLGGGYRFNEALSLGVSVGYIFNTVDEWGGVDLSQSGFDLYLHQIPCLVVFGYELQNRSRIIPFVSVGAGGVFSIYHERWGYYGPGGLWDTGNDADIDAAFAYQLNAGLRYKFGRNVEFGLGYKLFGTGDSSFDLDYDTVSFDGGLNHSVGLSLRVLF